MTQEDRKLLLQDLCTRLPYGVMCKTNNSDKPQRLKGIIKHHKLWWFEFDGFRSLECKPYLRSMSSMTEEERKEIGILIREKRPNPYGIINNEGVDNLLLSVSVTSTVLIDWLLSKHFDVRGLIPKGLAIPVTKENNPYKD